MPSLKRFIKLLRCGPRLSCLFAFAWLSAFTACYAGDDVSEQSYLQDFPVVLSASRLSQPLSETPNAVTVIDRAMIKASGFRNIADVFKLVPGMYVDYKDGYTPFVSYRGGMDEYTRRMQVLVDGRSVYLPPYNTVDWEDLPLHVDDIERIEVVRGPAATSYGSNSILGVINITTRDAAALNGASISATKGNGGGGNGVSDAVVHYGISGERLDYRLTFGARSDNGFHYPSSSPNYYNGYDDGSTTYMANLRSNFRPNATDSFDLQLGFSTGKRATGDPRNTNSPPHEIRNKSSFQQLNWLRTLDQQNDFRMHYYRITRSSTDERYNAVLAPVVSSTWLTDNVSAQRQELELQHTAQIGKANRLVWGVAVRHESADAPTLLKAPQSLQQSRLFANDEWRISSRFLLNAGAMLENNGMGHRNLSPKLALNYHAAPEHTFRAGISVAHRNPAWVEESSNNRYVTSTTAGPNTLYQYLYSSGGLRPERALSREIGYLGSFHNGLSLDVRAYNDQVSDVIFFDPFIYPGSQRQTTYDFRNEFTVHNTGLEGTVKYDWGARKNSLTFNFAHQLSSAVLVGTPVALAQSPPPPPIWLPPAQAPFWPLLWPGVQNAALAAVQDVANGFGASVPMNSFSLLYSRQMSDAYSASVGYFQQGAVHVYAGEGPQPLNRRLDMRVARRLGPSGKAGGGEVSLTVQNMLDDNNVGYSGYLFDRRAYLAATIHF
ncbi:MAG: TonB-dependent receptor plug domain-containing protein [Nitrosomonadales bacterium]|nr:TonB-dependent receptor plug domain-containing protein [Nitrosomonadales bacterium]